MECGALDGERSSNSIYFEQRRGWTGLLIEMDPSWYKQIQGKNRKSYTINACISPYQHPTKVSRHISAIIYCIMGQLQKNVSDYFSQLSGQPTYLFHVSKH